MARKSKCYNSYLRSGLEALAVATAFAGSATGALTAGVTGVLFDSVAPDLFTEPTGTLTLVGLVVLALEAIVGLLTEVSAGVIVDRRAAVEATLEVFGLGVAVGIADILRDAPLRPVFRCSSVAVDDNPSWSEVAFAEPAVRRVVVVVVADDLAGGLLPLFARFVRVVDDINGSFGDEVSVTGVSCFVVEDIDNGRRGSAFSILEPTDGTA